MKSKLKIKGMSVLLVLAIAMTSLIAGSLTANAAEDNAKIVLGDVNGDDKIDVADVTEVQKYIAGLVKFTDNQKKAVNAFDDEKIDIADATEIQKYIAGYEVNDNIGKTWQDAETTTKTTLRYILINPNVCNTCDVPWIHKDGSDWTDAEASTHMLNHSDKGESAHYRSQYDWYYIDENGHYHDLDDNDKVPHDHATEKEKNVFDPDFDPYLTWVAIDNYNSAHTNQFYWSIEQYAVCNSCNSDGTCIYDEWGGTGNIKDGQLRLTDPIETIIYPETVADIDAYNKAYENATQAVDQHKTEHKKRGDIPEYVGDDIDSYVISINKIYNTETVNTEAGWY